MRQRVSQLRRCYESVLRSNPSISGRMVVVLEIDDAGRVPAVRVPENDTGSQGLADCFVARLRRFRFSPPEGGPVEIELPFVFRRSS